MEVERGIQETVACRAMLDVVRQGVAGRQHGSLYKALYNFVQGAGNQVIGIGGTA